MRKNSIIVLMLMLILSLVGCGKTKGDDISLKETDLADVQEEKADSSIFVYVCGAVNAEGVYELPSGSRVYEAIAAAGGFRGDAATTEVNQAEVLEDEARIYVPTLQEMQQGTTSKNGKININKATKEELMTRPGVGQSRAESIIQYRKEQGAFKKIEDLMQIAGIKEGLFEKIKTLISV